MQAPRGGRRRSRRGGFGWNDAKNYASQARNLAMSTGLDNKIRGELEKRGVSGALIDKAASAFGKAVAGGLRHRKRRHTKRR